MLLLPGAHWGCTQTEGAGTEPWGPASETDGHIQGIQLLQLKVVHFSNNNNHLFSC